MKYIFIANPNAGKKDSSSSIRQQIAPYSDMELYLTRGTRDATRFVNSYCSEHPDEEVCFVACGGDGTICEVASGMVGHPNASLACFPVGSGDDYVKYFRDVDGIAKERFLDVKALREGSNRKVDIMEVTVGGGENDGTYYSINVCNFGFDAMVCRTMIEVKRKPIIGGRNSYTTGIVKAIFTSRRNHVTIAVDGKPFNDETFMLCTLGNGRYVGGAYCCCPLSRNDDGLIEVNLIRPVSIPRFAFLVGEYKKGTHINKPRLRKVLSYTQGKCVELSHSEPFWVSIDGELLCGTHYTIRQLHQAISLRVPKA